MRVSNENWLRLLCAIILTISSDGFAQVSATSPTVPAIRNPESCETLIVGWVDSVRKIDSGRPKRLTKSFNQKSISPALSSLLKGFNSGELISYRLKGRRQTALIMHTMRVGRPLSEDSIQDWFIQVGENAVGFESSTTNPNLVFWDKEGKLNYFTVLYNEAVSQDSLSNLVSVDFRQLQLSDSGRTQLIDKQKSERCILRVENQR